MILLSLWVPGPIRRAYYSSWYWREFFREYLKGRLPRQ